MIRDPKAWRQEAGLTMRQVAEQAGIGGRNPPRTYSRYEAGSNVCPAPVIERIRELSGGAVGPEAWHQVRLAHLRKQEERRCGARA